ncbi:YfaZ family outer membrane protein [Halomonas sp. C05BenzN]|uniref:YfaZ family outer membrane protein n=1 Tax=Halomonas sp. C05BenzN TaxID=3411041 RepID=UPI003B95F912
MRLTIIALAGALLLGSATLAQAQSSSLDLNLSQDAVQFEAAGELTHGIVLGGGVIDSDYRHDATAFHAQLLGVERTNDYDIGVGARWTQFDTDHGKGGGLGLGGYGYAYVPAMPALSLGGYGFYTPGAVSTRDLDDGYELGVRARYAFTPTVDGYVGYRALRADFDDDRGGSRTLDSGPLVGVRLTF